MARYRTEIDSTMSPEEAFAFMAAFDRCRDWDPSVVQADRLGGDEPGPGTRFLVVSRFLGREVPLEYRITRWEPPNRLDLRAERGSVSSHDQVFVTATTSGSTVVYDARLEAGGVAGRLLDPLLGLAFGRLARRAAAGLRRELNP